MEQHAHLTEWGWSRLLTVGVKEAAAVPGKPLQGECRCGCIPDQLSSFKPRLLLDPHREIVSAPTEQLQPTTTNQQQVPSKMLTDLSTQAFAVCGDGLWSVRSTAYLQ